MNVSICLARFSWTLRQLFLTCQQIDRCAQAVKSKLMSRRALSILPNISQIKSSWSASRRCFFFLFPVRKSGPSKNLSPFRNLAAPPNKVPTTATMAARMTAATLMLAKFAFFPSPRLLGTERKGTAISMSICNPNVTINCQPNGNSNSLQCCRLEWRIPETVALSSSCHFDSDAERRCTRTTALVHWWGLFRSSGERWNLCRWRRSNILVRKQSPGKELTQKVSSFWGFPLCRCVVDVAQKTELHTEKFKRLQRKRKL